MVGGTVIETIDTGTKVWINCKDNNDKCAIYVKRDSKSLCISEGDMIWWQGQNAYWTAKNRQDKTIGKVDESLERIGNSGVDRPKI